ARCLAGSTLALVGTAYDIFNDKLVEKAKSRKVGNGLEEGVSLGPVISAAHKERVLGYIQKGIDEGAELVLDGRVGFEDSAGYFLGPTIFDNVKPEMTIGKEEIFGPVLCLIKVETLEDAITI